ncbi:hypothetical protein RvY_09644 [Ramazzottius varieornatus]|uniref:Uncharacterized protein n=1 Tax=Ramazzottius varieornatus TaxID=947166 RepID=A0A1D1VFG4_RAMVA|nr:hypothetical protein RvY_09644 [Ramazzottius varieornatus]
MLDDCRLESDPKLGLLVYGMTRRNVPKKDPPVERDDLTVLKRMTEEIRRRRALFVRNTVDFPRIRNTAKNGQS